MKKLIITLILWCYCIFLLSAQPKLGNSLIIEGHRIYSDLLNPKKYYFAPGKIKLVYEENGRPDFQLLLMSYSGNVVNDNQNQLRHTNLSLIHI